MSTTFTTSTTSRPVLVVASEKVTGPTLLEAVYGGKVRFAKERASGTTRAWTILAPGTKERAQAETVLERRAAKQPVEAIAKDMKVSVPTVRRMITALAFTREVESMKATEKAALAKSLSAEVAAAPKEQKAAPAKAEPKAPAAKKAPAKAAPKAKESNAARLRRMQAEGKAKVPAPSEK